MVVIREEIDPYFHSSETEDDIEAEEDIEYEELKKRMWKDRVLLQKLKEKRHKDEPDQEAKQEASRKKKMSRAQDSVLKYMVKIMEVCNAQGFVYGIVPEKGKPVTGSSDSLREWWKEQIRFDQTAPTAIAKYLPLLGKGELDASSYILPPPRFARHYPWVTPLCPHATLCPSTKEVPSGERATSPMVAQWVRSLVG